MIKLYVNENETKYLELRVTKHLDELSGHFSSKVLSRFKAGDKVAIKVEEHILLDGYIDVSKSTFSDKGKSFEIHGRDKTADLVDSCLVSAKPFKNVPFDRVARELIKGFDIIIGNAPTDNTDYVPSPGDTIFKALSDISIKKNIRMVSKSGQLFFSSLVPGTAPAYKFAEGVNILSISSTEDHRARFKNYIGRTVIATNIKDANYQSEEIDAEISRERTLLFISDSDLENECVFQKDLRKAKSEIISIKVYGFVHNKKVPEILDLVQVESGSLGIKGEYYIVGLSFKYDYKQRKEMTLQLASRNSFKQRKTEDKDGGW